MRSVGRRTHAVLAITVMTLSGSEAVAAPRVAFANAAELDRGAKTLIESLRPGLIQDGYETVPPGELRDALEAPLAASEDLLAQARSLLAAAKDAYAGFQFETALEHLARVNPLLAGQPHSEKLVDILAERYVLEGLVHAGAKNPSAAEAAFAVVKRLRPDRKLDPATYHPRIVALFARAGDRSEKGTPLTIEATPGARVVVDGAEMGAAPVQLSLAVGTHYVNVDADGFIPQGAAIEVTAQSKKLSFSLEPAPPEARARRLRDALRASAAMNELREAGDGICALATADILVVIRNREGATFEAAVYRCEPRELSDWVALPSAQFFAALGPASPDAGGRATAAPKLTKAAPVEDRGGKRAWYRTWWGVGLLASATAVAGTALYFALRPEDEFVIGGFCVGEGCLQ